MVFSSAPLQKTIYLKSLLSHRIMIKEKKCY